MGKEARAILWKARRSIFGAGLSVLTFACAPRLGARTGSPSESPVGPHAKPSLEGARELDQQGVKAFSEGRYADATRLFRGSLALGGPPTESWNIARCLERLDDPEAAAAAIDEYRAAPSLSVQDRAEAERESRALTVRPSWLTVTTTPDGATVTVDGAAAGGPTPTTFEVHPGSHSVVVKRSGYATESQVVEARFGRAIVVALDLQEPRK